MVGIKVESLLGRGVVSQMGLIANVNTVEEGIGYLNTDLAKIML